MAIDQVAALGTTNASRFIPRRPNALSNWENRFRSSSPLNVSAPGTASTG
jgi:hypothetical protein